MDQRETIETPCGTLTVSLAQRDDLDATLALDRSSYEWRASIGFPGGVAPCPLTELFAASIARKGMYLARRDGVPAGKLSLQSQDAGALPHEFGATYEEAAAKGRDLLQFVIRSAQEEGEPLPAPRMISDASTSAGA